MLKALRRTKTNPVFFPDRFRALLAHDPERVERAFTDPESIDLLTWNVFASMDSDSDRDFLAHLLEPLAGPDVRAPVRLTLWTGRRREPLLRPSAAYLDWIREQAGAGAGLEAFAAPAEVAVRVETADLVALVDTTMDALPRGSGGRDRLAELVDAGLEQTRHLSKALTVGVIYRAGTHTARALSERVRRLQDPDELAKALPWREDPPEVRLTEQSWQDLLRVWEAERGNYRLFGQPVRGFLGYAASLGLR